MKRLLLSLFTVTLLTTAYAQHQALPVEPGSKGQLPTFSDVPQGDTTIVPILKLDNIYAYPFTFNGYTYSDIYVQMYFTSPSSIGADYYVPQVCIDGNWADVKDANDTTRVMMFETNSYNYCPEAECNYQGYRLRIVGGPQDGKLSNAEMFSYPLIHTYFSWGTSGCTAIVGETMYAPYVREAATYIRGESQTISNPEPYLTYKWYRRNPYSGEMTRIEGADSAQYILSNADIGYYIVGEVLGDGQHLDAMKRNYTETPVTMPLYCSMPYAGYDGVILNTEYILPDPSLLAFNASYAINDTTWFDGKVQPEVTTIKPGQYKLRYDFSQANNLYNVITYADNQLGIAPYCRYGFEGEEFFMTREAIMVVYDVECMVSATENGQLANAKIEFMSEDIDGNVKVIETVETGSDTVQAMVPIGDYYLRTQATGTCLQTYFPKETRGSLALTTHIPNVFNWDTCFNIEMQPAPAPLTGKGVIEGAIVQSAAAAAMRGLNMTTYADNSAAGVTMLLIDADGNIVATTVTDAQGKFRFEHVPYGTYTIAPDAAGFSLEATAQVTLTEEHPTVTEVDYNVVGNSFVSASASGIETIGMDNKLAPSYDLYGRRTGSAHTGIKVRSAKMFIAR
ncbi:MAG: carboxypeptidase-like regulatory domain-containing protein [Bacteroidales bacterium]|nr:carboxypeptidase-like regulatory domain-containing protein [Bacteroidales bacterium]